MLFGSGRRNVINLLSTALLVNLPYLVREVLAARRGRHHHDGLCAMGVNDTVNKDSTSQIVQ